MNGYVLCSLDDFDEEYPLIRVEVPGSAPLAVYLIDGEVYCTDDTCSHGQASLADGDLEGFDVVCPFHGGRFDVRTGEPTSRPCFVPLRTHQVEIRDGSVVLVGDAAARDTSPQTDEVPSA